MTYADIQLNEHNARTMNHSRIGKYNAITIDADTRYSEATLYSTCQSLLSVASLSVRQ